jgi:AcrR family transcriptional regulator
VAKAHEIVAAEGIDALTVRHLAQALGVTANAIYYHVQGKPALIERMIEDVWGKANVDPSELPTDLVELIIALGVRVRRTWLDHLDLAPFATAVAEPSEQLLADNTMMAGLLRFAGFPDVGLAYSSTQTMILGSVTIAATRRVSSAYFGRDEDDVERRSVESVTAAGAEPDVIAVTRGRFSAADDEYFEESLRSLLRGLLAGGGPGSDHVQAGS